MFNIWSVARHTQLLHLCCVDWSWEKQPFTVLQRRCILEVVIFIYILLHNNVCVTRTSGPHVFHWHKQFLKLKNLWFYWFLNNCHISSTFTEKQLHEHLFFSSLKIVWVVNCIIGKWGNEILPVVITVH